MSLPELLWQILYARVAWGVVLAAVVVGLLGWRGRGVSRRAMVGVALVAGVLQVLPHELSAAYWLGLAFQSPSVLLAALGAASLHRRWRGLAPQPLLPLPLAACLALAGAILYLDASGWTALGVYFLGFGPRGAPVAAVILGLGAVLVIARARSAGAAPSVLLAVSAFMLLRLPTGNLWDALLDPFLWLWSVGVLLRAGRLAWRQRSLAWRSGPDARPVDSRPAAAPLPSAKTP